MYKHILIATDGSDVARKGVDHGLALARALGARVTIFTASDPYPFYQGAAMAGIAGEPLVGTFAEDQESNARVVLAEACQRAEAAGVKVETIHKSWVHAAEATIETVRELGCDVIVMGSHGLRGIGRLVLGSTTWEVVSHSTIPVLVVR